MRTKVCLDASSLPFRVTVLSEPCAGSLDVTTEVKEEASSRSQKLIHDLDLT
jgi:hypothetical protein